MSTSPTDSARSKLTLAAGLWRHAFFWAGLFALAVIVANAWVCDDAYISLRTVEAFLRGDGLTWNPGERVQAFTHPLWLAGLIVTRALVGDVYPATLLLGLLSTVAAGILLVRLSPIPGRATLPLLALALSPSVVQFATSGLENPATHVFILCFFAAYLSAKPRLLTQVLLTALLICNRMDAVLFVLPALLITAWRHLRQRGLRPTLIAILLGSLPFVAWEVFSLLYYGAFIPNTAYAKLAHGLPRHEILAQGLSYLLTFVTFDPAGALLAVAGLSLAFLEPADDSRRRHLALGGVLYLLYLVWIGGDFMAGRFLTPVIVLGAACLLTSRAWGRWHDGGTARRTVRQLALAALICALGIVPQFHVGTVLRESFALPLPQGPLPMHATHWVNEEQHHYMAATGLWNVQKKAGSPPLHPWFDRIAAKRKAGGVHVARNIGFAGYAAADRVHLIDPYGLAEPLLARLPAFRNVDWHVGHYHRIVPPGYERSIASGVCELDDAELCQLFDWFRLVTRGPIFSVERWAAIWALHRYVPSKGLALRFRHGELKHSAPRPPRPVRFMDSGLEVAFDPPQQGPIRVQVKPCVRYELRFFSAEVMQQAIALTDRSCTLTVSPSAAFERVWILPLERPESRKPFFFESLTQAKRP